MGIKLKPHNQKAYNIEKQDSLVGRRTVLSNEEKLNLMLEYLDSIEGTDEVFSSGSVYKGYNIGKMRTNLRTSYWNGTLKITDETLKKFMEKGIIIEKPERTRISVEEKYEFLVSTIGKSEEELKQAKMYSGQTYKDVRDSIQISYNKGSLNLSPEQIDILKRNGILNLSMQEKEELSKQYNFSQIDIVNIQKKYCSIEEFIRKFKNREIDYKFKSDTFVGERILIASKNPMTVEQKKVICSLAKDLFGSDFDRAYIDADKLMDSLRILDDRKQKILTLKYGLNGENSVESQEIGKLFKVTSSRVGQIEADALMKIRSRYGKEILIQEDNAGEINKQLAETQIQEESIAKLEEILILLYENDSLETENLKLNLSENQKEYLAQQYGFSELETGKSIQDLIADLEDRLSNYYYYGLNGDISKRRTLEAKIERNKKVIEIYNKLKERYLNDEDIFNPECIIPGIEIEHIMPVKEITEDQIESISSLGISINLLTYLHHFGLETIQDVKNLSENDKKMSELLNKVQDENTRNNLRKVIENVKKEYGDKSSSYYCTLFDLNFCVSTYNSLARLGIKYAGDILKYYDAEKGNFKPLLKIRGIGLKAYKEILDVLEKLGLIDENGQVIEIDKDNNNKQQQESEKTIDATCTVWELNLKTRTCNSLLRYGIEYVGDILKYYDTKTGNFEQLLEFRGLGSKGYKEVLEVLKELGFIDENGKLIEISEDNEQQQNNETIGDMSEFTLDIANAAQRRVDVRTKAKKAKVLLQEYEEKSLLGKNEEESSLET